MRERIFLEEDTIIQVPILALEGVILFPNETIPLRIRNSHLTSYFRTRFACNQNSLGANPILLGVVCRTSHRARTSHCGTIIEALATKFEDDTVVLKANGRCRFKELSRFTDSVYNVVMINALILGDNVPSISASAAHLHNRSLASPANPFPLWVRFISLVIVNIFLIPVYLNQIYDLYDAKVLMSRVQEAHRQVD